MLTHHLTEATLQEYSVGALSKAMETLIACHLTVCPHCRHRAQLHDAVGGVMLDRIEPATVQTLPQNIIERASQQAELTKTKPLEDDLSSRNTNGIPRPLARLLPAPIDQLKWRTIAPGLKQFNLTNQPRKDGAFKLISAAPGLSMSEHTHKHRELTYIVCGSYSDKFGQFNAGDISDLDDDDLHEPVVDSEIPCISLIATDAPVKFSGMMGKVIQPFIGI